MKESDIKLLESNGWVVECESPFEIRNIEPWSFASGIAAQVILDELKELNKRNKSKLNCVISYNNSEEMMSIRNHNDVSVFYGNYWDFDNSPESLFKLFKSLGLKVMINDSLANVD